MRHGLTKEGDLQLRGSPVGRGMMEYMGTLAAAVWGAPVTPLRNLHLETAQSFSALVTRVHFCFPSDSLSSRRRGIFRKNCVWSFLLQAALCRDLLQRVAGCRGQRYT